MPLEVLLRPGDSIFIGTAKVVVRSGDYTKIAIEGSMPVLRETDFVELGDTPNAARRLYVMLQDAYMRDDFDRRSAEYTEHVTDLLDDTPASAEIIAAIHRWVAKGNLYKALKTARPLAGLD